MNNQSLFEKYFLKCLDEQNIAGPGGVFGPDLQGGEGQGGSLKVSDWYAKGDTRIPSILGAKKEIQSGALTFKIISNMDYPQYKKTITQLCKSISL